MPAEQTGLLIPVDDMVLGTVYHLSDNGSLAGDKSLASVHPDYLTGTGSANALASRPAQSEPRLISTATWGPSSAVCSPPRNAPCFDGQVKQLAVGQAEFQTDLPADRDDKTVKSDEQIGKGEVKPAPDQRILVVRVKDAKRSTPMMPDALVWRFTHRIDPSGRQGQ